MDHEPKHGDERALHSETVHGKPVEFQAPTGEVVHSGPVSSTTFTVVDRWCSGCKEWVECKGVLGRVFFMAEHDAHATESGGPSPV